jgi:hypothetical protein
MDKQDQNAAVARRMSPCLPRYRLFHGRSTQAPCDSSFANDSSPAITVLIHTSFVFLLIATALAPTVGFVSAGAISDIENNPTKTVFVVLCDIII